MGKCMVNIIFAIYSHNSNIMCMYGEFIIRDILELEKEANYIYENIVLPNWCSDGLHWFPSILYWLMMLVMSKIDITSQYWDTTPLDKRWKWHQTVRMVWFLTNYVNIDKQINESLVQIWRHTLMHEGSPSGNYLLHWKEHLPREQHYTIANGILNISLIYLIEDLKNWVYRYIDDIKNNPDLQEYFNARSIIL